MTKLGLWNRQYQALFWALAFAACGSSPEPAAPPRDTNTTPRLAGKAPPATGGYPSVIMIAPEIPIETAVPAEPALMDQHGTAFSPKLLVVRPGQPVDFKNSEDVLHNVHVIEAETRKTEFNVGTPVVGAYRHVFESEGAYDVSCNIHPSMAAFVIVTAAPFFAVADSEGDFELEAVPEGAYVVRVWNLDPKRRRERKVVIDPATKSLTLNDP
jgi:plastocyanin